MAQYTNSNRRGCDSIERMNKKRSDYNDRLTNDYLLGGGKDTQKQFALKQEDSFELLSKLISEVGCLAEEFMGFNQTEVSCENHKTNLDAYEFLSISAPVSKDSKIEDLLNDFCSDQDIDWHCIECKKDRISKHSLKIVMPPKSLLKEILVKLKKINQKLK